MILQTDSRLSDSINKYGCYFMSILFLANKHAGFELDSQSINALQGALKSNGHMGDNCYIKDPTAIFRYVGMKAEYTGVHESFDYVCGKDEIEILCYQRTGYRHFMVGNKGIVAYDPMGNSSGGHLISKRIFKI